MPLKKRRRMITHLSQDFSFLEPPTLDVQFSPLGAGSVGFAVTDLPGVMEILRVRVAQHSLWCWMETAKVLKMSLANCP